MIRTKGNIILEDDKITITDGDLTFLKETLLQLSKEIIQDRLREVQTQIRVISTADTKKASKMMALEINKLIQYTEKTLRVKLRIGEGKEDKQEEENNHE